MSISQYISNNETLNKMDFITVYATITELFKSGLLKLEDFKDVRILQS